MLLDAQPAQKTPPTEELAAQLGKNYHGQVTLRRTVLGLFVALMAIPAPAQAYPYYSLRPVDFVLAGPTDGHLASLFFNPAAIRVQPGSQVLVQGGVSGFIGSYQRQAALPSGFSPGGTGSPAQTVPIRWANPQALAALAWDLRSDSVTLGLAFSTPVLDLTNFRRDDAPIEQLSTRYHAIYEESYSLWGSLAIGLKLKSWLLLGPASILATPTAACRSCAMAMPKRATRSAAAAARANSGQVAPTSKWMSGHLATAFPLAPSSNPFWIGCGSAFRT
ncbi:MAG: hypothetical protein U0787_16410 [Polyangia bacterium]